MKKSIISLSLVASIVLLCANSYSQFEGIIKFDKMKNDTTRYVYYVKNKQIRIEELGSDGSKKGVQLIDLNKNSVLAISDDRKMYMDVETKKDPVVISVDVKKTGNKKKIQNYDCTEYVVKNEKENTEITYWAGGDKFDFFMPMLKLLNRKDRLSKYFVEMKDIGNVFTFEGVEKTMDGAVKTMLTVTMVEAKKVDPSMFTVPKGYVKFEK